MAFKSGLFHTVNMTFYSSLFSLYVFFDVGFMMECSTWSGAESLNLQFMVPKVGYF